LARDWYAAQCAAIFGPERAWPNATDFGARYNGLRQNATRVFYSAGRHRNLLDFNSILATDGNAYPKTVFVSLAVGKFLTLF
jgi:hypothetical protein